MYSGTLKNCQGFTFFSNYVIIAMAPIRYSLHYEDYSEHMMSRFGKLLQMQSLVDMTLMCNSHTLRVHKAVLAASSAYFQDVLQKQTGEPLIILKMRFSVLKCLVEFMYCGKTQCAEENLDELVSAAQFLKIKGLAKVTREGLGIQNPSELPVFTPPVVINRPPQSLLDPHLQQDSDPKLLAQPQVPVSSSIAPGDALGRNKDTIVRVPFDIENGRGTGVPPPELPRVTKPRRGRGGFRALSRVAGAWEGGGVLSRAAGRALLRREQDSRKAINQLKNLQSRHMQDYMSMSHSHPVNAMRPEQSPAQYLNMENDLMYMDQSSLDAMPTYSQGITSETITSSYTAPTSNADNPAISSAMSQYVNALKNAGLPTDLPILFESGDGSYINVNEQVLLDMVQSSEIQYEVIEQPNIIEKVSDPSEIKSIDDLSKSIERGEMMMGGRGYAASNYEKDASRYNREDAINSLNAILPDNLESFGEQQNFVVLDPPLQETNNMDSVNASDFSCIDGDMQFFTKSMSDDVKKYYEEPHFNDARVMEQLCPTSTTLDTNFSMSLLDTKNGNMSQQYHPLNPDDMRRNEDCYDFGLPLPQTNDFKEDALDCLMAATPKRTDDLDDEHLNKRAQEREEIIKDLMNIEKTITQTTKVDKDFTADVQDFDVFNQDTTKDKSSNELTDWGISNEKNENAHPVTSIDNEENMRTNTDYSVMELTDSTKNIQLENHCEKPDESSAGIDDSIENEIPFTLMTLKTVPPMEMTSNHSVDNLFANMNNDKDETPVGMSISSEGMVSVTEYTPLIDLTDGKNIQLEGDDDCDKENENPDVGIDDIPFAVGLLPLKQVQPTEDSTLMKRKHSVNNFLDNNDAKCLKRKMKFKKL